MMIANASYLQLPAAVLLGPLLYCATTELLAADGVPLERGADGREGATQIAFGGEVRLRYERFENAQWGRGAQDEDGYGLIRVMFHADVKYKKAWRSLLELKSGFVAGRNGGPRSTDEDRLDLHQALVDRAWGLGGDKEVFIRAGRQELSYGSSRLVSTRESPNVRLAFDGIKSGFRGEAVRVDLLLARPAETNRGVFDDATDKTRTLWGAYAVMALAPDRRITLDTYYLGSKRDHAVFARGSGVEERHSWGIRFAGKREAWDFNFEGVWQAGRFETEDIRAWTLASDSGFTWANHPLSPRFGLKADISSGDSSDERGRLGTFNALYPRGAYFGEIGLLGPANLIDLQPSLELRCRPGLTLTGAWGIFWRTESTDGVYGPSLNLLQAPRASVSSRAVGDSPSVHLRWVLNKKVTVNAVGAHFRPGRFLREVGARSEVSYLSTWLTWQF